ncbi:MAG: adenylyl-sulfate kinase [Methyloligella sp.]|nr:MAG: adenylyl-sulfate kinase [Methyloligella sp.]
MTELTKDKQQEKEQEQSAVEFGQAMNDNNIGQKSLLRFLTCGSVDDGKSTLIGRLLYDSKLVAEDQLQSLQKDSKAHGTQHGELDLALLVDGLQAEREQGITIDVAYRYFSTLKRKFIVADTPGHEQYTRNMATGASTCDMAVILIDARKGVITQTKRHSCIVSMLGIKNVILAVNKMDLVEYSEERYNEIVADYIEFAEKLELDEIHPIPISALTGENVTTQSASLEWYEGPTLLGFLEEFDVPDKRAAQALRYPVQWVNRPDLNFRGFSGTLTSGQVKVGDEIVVLPSGKESIVDRIVTYDGDLDEANPGQSVTLTLKDEIDISRGDVIAHKENRPCIAQQIEASLIWLSEEPLQIGRAYQLKAGHQTVIATVSRIDHKLDVNTLEEVEDKQLSTNDVGVCELNLSKPIVFDPYTNNLETGNFILIDRLTNATIAAGLVKGADRRADNVHWQHMAVDKDARALAKGQKPCCLWFTGLSGSGKSTIANVLESKLHLGAHHTYLLDGDNVRHGLNRDLGFSDEDRTENIRRVAEAAKLMVDAGLIVMVSFISPFKADRRLARSLFDDGEFIEIHVDTPLDVCEARDIKGLYAKARAGEIKQFTGIDSAYEEPENAEIVLAGAETPPEDLADEVMNILRREEII